MIRKAPSLNPWLYWILMTGPFRRVTQQVCFLYLLSHLLSLFLTYYIFILDDNLIFSEMFRFIQSLIRPVK